ncbi:hypothetical protein [Streptomyces sp. NPDC060065]|uniref:hypothetical protein n=1 Tax=Streptomyces sp. NPDC060065 TaxID=3347050 RepID=UPI0036740EBF
MTVLRIDLRIARLVLDGLPSGAHDEASPPAAVESALIRRLADALPPGVDPAAVGHRVARAVHGSIEHGSIEHGSIEHGSNEHGSIEHGSAER